MTVVFVIERDKDWETNIVFVASSLATAQKYCAEKGAVDQGDNEWLFAIPSVEQPGKFDEYYSYRIQECELDTEIEIF